MRVPVKQGLKQLVAQRNANKGASKSLKLVDESQMKMASHNVIDEVQEVISLPDNSMTIDPIDVKEIELGSEVTMQLRDFLKCIAGLYNDNPFHNFEHAS